LCPVARAAGIDQPRIPLHEIVGLDGELGSGIITQVGDEHVRTLDQLVEMLPALNLSEVESDAALAAIGRFKVGVGAQAWPLDGAHASRGVPATARPLDLDDVCTPVGQDHRCCGYECVLRHLYHPDTLHHVIHTILLVPSAATSIRRTTLDPAARPNPISMS
jgi:hypothetical protein